MGFFSGSDKGNNKPDCLVKWRDSHGIWRVCHKKRGHSGKHGK